MDLSRLSPNELQALIASAKEQLHDATTQHRQATRDRLINMASEAGYEIGELFGFRGKTKGKRRPTDTNAPARYRHPTDASLTWGGRGKRPRWVHDWLATGGSIESLRA